MEKSIPDQKLSEKGVERVAAVGMMQVRFAGHRNRDKRKIGQTRRQTWGEQNPVTRKSANSKAYNRRKAQNWRKESSEFCALSFCVSDPV